MSERLRITESYPVERKVFNGSIDDIIIKLRVLKDGIINSRDGVVIENIRIRDDYGDYVCEVERYETDDEYDWRNCRTKRQLEMLAEERTAMMRKLADIDRQINEIEQGGATGGEPSKIIAEFELGPEDLS